MCVKLQQSVGQTGHFMNSVLNTFHIYSWVGDSFLEVTSCFFLPHLSNLTARNKFPALPFNTCSRSDKNTCQLALSRFIQNN